LTDNRIRKGLTGWEFFVRKERREELLGAGVLLIKKSRESLIYP
jgi:hypothetical protein